jgi:hypothetical protein
MYTIKKLSIFICVSFMTMTLYAQEEVTIKFHNFLWGTSIEAFKAVMGNPVHVENKNGFQSFVYENISFAGYRAFMVVYFSQKGLEGGAYYFDTNNLEELMLCYTAVQNELIALYGATPPPPAGRYEKLLTEMRTYETCWNLPSGYIHLKVNTRRSDPVTLWISFPTLTRILDGSS